MDNTQRVYALSSLVSSCNKIIVVTFYYPLSSVYIHIHSSMYFDFFFLATLFGTSHLDSGAAYNIVNLPQEREKQLLELQTKMDEVSFIYSSDGKVSCRMFLFLDCFSL